MSQIIFKLFLFALFFYKSVTSQTAKSRYFPRYHLALEHGWMSNPSGFCKFKDEYHIFYQYNPETNQNAGVPHWGHAKSQDLFHWEHLPIAIYPDEWYDKTGVFSGSTLVENGTMYIFYTGNGKITGRTQDKAEFQALAMSTDGVNFMKYEGNPIINATDYHPNIMHPKIWKYQDLYYMILGDSFDNDTHGRVILFSSQDMFNWEEVTILGESDGSLGYMWEYPDLFELNGKFVFMFCPQGVAAERDKYRNLYQCGYIVGDMDYENNVFTAQSDFKELDNGHDFYAMQTMLDTSGRRLLVAWLSTLEKEYPERNDGWAGQMTLVRELNLTPDNILVQTPVFETLMQTQNVLHIGKAVEGDVFELEDKRGLIIIQTSSLKSFHIILESENHNSTVIISYDPETYLVTLDRGGTDGVRRTYWRPRGKFNWTIYIDASSIELFCGVGEATFSSRFHPDGEVSVRIGEGCEIDDFLLITMGCTAEMPEEYYSRDEE